MEEDIFSSEIDSFIEDVYQSSYNNGKVPRRLCRMSISVPTKGLINAPGENNCYLNASVQLLWHMNVFRRSFRLLEGHACLENACIFCALKNIFQQFQDSNATVLAADDLRKAMANAFMDDHRFQLGRMDDAAECFENILHRLHNHIANSEFADTCSAKHCIPHQKFGQHILEQTSCQCQATSEPKAFYQFVHYVSASALVDLVHSNSLEEYQYTFGENLKTIMQYGERRPCPDERRCLFKGKQPLTTVQTTLMNCPDVVTVGVIWDTDHPSAKYISSFMDCIGENLYLVDLFDNIPDDEHRRIGLNLSGVVAYYGKHYTSFFYNSKNNIWYYFDDEIVQELGQEWVNVKTKFQRSKFQPLLLTYTNAFGKPVDVADAPPIVDIVSKEKLLCQPPTFPVNQKQRGHSQRHHKKGRRTHNSSDNSLKLPKNNSDDTCRSCKVDSPRSSKKVLSSKNSNLTTSDNSGPQFGHCTLTNDHNESFSNSVYDKEPKTTEVSLSQCSIGDVGVNDSKQTESNIGNDTNINKTSEFLRKTFNHIKKNKSSTNKNLKCLREQDMDPLREVSYADVGFDLYHSKLKKKLLPSNPVEATEASKQLQNLERHQEVLNIPKNKITEARSEPVLPEYDVLLRTSSNASSEFMKQIDSNLVDLPRSPEIVELIPDDDLYYKQGEFESLVNRGEYYSNESEKFEKEGDTTSALQMCLRAKNAFRNACQIPGINESVIQFADLKHMQCVQKEKILQQKPSLALLQQKVALVLSAEKESNKSISECEFACGTVPDPEIRQHPLPDVVAPPLTKSGNPLQSDSVRNKGHNVVHAVQSSDSSMESESIYDGGRSSVLSDIDLHTADKGTALFYIPHTNKLTKASNISINKPNVAGNIESTKSEDQILPQPSKAVNTTEKVRQSTQLNPKLYDPSAYTKNKKEKLHQEKTIYDSPLQRRKCFEKETKEKNETIMDDPTSKGITSSSTEKFIAETLRTFCDKDTRPLRCQHCGWKLVETKGKLCFSCQSYL